jgi:hypothetical protein
MANVFSYFSINLQRADIQIDTSFLGDIIVVSTTMLEFPSSPIRPAIQLPRKTVVSTNFHWLEASPLFLLFAVKALTGRTSAYGSMDARLRLIPTIFPMKIVVPGIIVAEINGALDVIFDQILADYKTALLHQMLLVLGTSGKVLTAFGVTSTIAKILNISMVSKLTDSRKFTITKSGEFDNNIDLSVKFTKEALNELRTSIKRMNIEPSSVIVSLAEGQNLDLKIRELPGSGISGVVGKETIDIMNEVKIMGQSMRVRIPRAFEGFVINEFDEKLAKAQMTIQLASKSFERIEIVIEGESEGVICMTGSQLFLLDSGRDKVRLKIGIPDIRSIEIDNVTIALIHGILKRPERINCKNEIDASKVVRFVTSRKIILELFSN